MLGGYVSQWGFFYRYCGAILPRDPGLTCPPVGALPCWIPKIIQLGSAIRMRSEGAWARIRTQPCYLHRHSPPWYQLPRTQGMSPSLTRKKTRNIRKKTPENGSSEISYWCIRSSRVSIYRRDSGVSRWSVGGVDGYSPWFASYTLRTSDIGVWTSAVLCCTSISVGNNAAIVFPHVNASNWFHSPIHDTGALHWTSSSAFLNHRVYCWLLPCSLHHLGSIQRDAL